MSNTMEKTEKYKLVLLPSGQRLYQDQHSEFPCYICPKCYEKNQLAMTLQELDTSAMGRAQNSWLCNNCQTCY